ncbi:MAG: rhodanese-like domain-containing protein [Bacteroidetes bacterium]|nr:rhodanese-like domain-containing protein [Bacteroidota bacterium]MDA1268040.1 rhodanese-like domain-containing protein [Bacteroidota bacterium]
MTPFRLSLLLFFLFLGFQSAFGQSLPYQALLKGLYDSSFPVVKPEQITDLKNYQVLDAREKVEFQVSHLQNAKWVGHETFSLKAVAELDKNKAVLIYCTVGARSEEIGKILQKEGFKKVYNLYGGIFHWVNEGRVVFANGKPTLQVHTYSMPWSIWLTKGEKVY